MGIQRQDYAVVNGLHAFVQSDAETEVFTGAGMAGNNERRWWSVHVQAAPAHVKPFQLLVAGVVMYECKQVGTWSNCQDTTIPLSGARGSIAINGDLHPDTVMTLHYHTHQTVDLLLTDGQTATAWPHTTVEFPVAEHIYVGDFVFKQTDVKSTQECHACAPGLKCAPP